MLFHSSSLVAPKLKEMDDVIRRIYDKLIKTSGDRRTLLVCNTFLVLYFRFDDYVSSLCLFLFYTWIKLLMYYRDFPFLAVSNH